MPTKGTFFKRKPLGLDLKYSSILKESDYPPELLEGLPRRPKNDSPTLFNLDFGDKYTPVKIEPRVWVIEFDKDLVDLIVALDKDVADMKAKKSEILKEVTTGLWESRNAVWNAIQNDLKKSFFNQKVTVPINHWSSNPAGAVKVENKAAEAAEKQSLSPILNGSKDILVGALTTELDKATKETRTRILNRLTTYSSLGSYISKNRWVIFGAVLVAGAGSVVYAIVDQTISAEQAFNLALKDETFSLSKVSGVIVGDAKLKTGTGNISAGLKDITFHESIKNWTSTGFVKSDYQVTQNVTGQHKLSFMIRPGQGVIAEKGEFSLSASWGKISANAGISGGFLNENRGLGGMLRLNYELSKGTSLFLEVSGQRKDGSYGRSAVAGWKFELD